MSVIKLKISEGSELLKCACPACKNEELIKSTNICNEYFTNIEDIEGSTSKYFRRCKRI